MEAAVADLRSGVLDGANVTMPHKRLAAALADDLAAEARRTGAVNTLVRVAGRIVGHNTDIAGVKWAWQWAGLSDAAPVLVLGAGGAAAAAIVALQDRALTISARNSARAARLVAELGVTAQVAPFPSGVAGAVVVNATPVGMHGESLPAEVLAEAGGLLDMAYGVDTPPAAAACRDAGTPYAAGTSMLLGQAVASFRLWTGRTPLAAMRAALDRALSTAVTP